MYFFQECWKKNKKNTEQDQPAVRSAVAAAAAAEVRFSMTCRFVDGQGKRGNVHILAIILVAFPDVVVFDGFIQLWNSLFTRKQNTRAWRKADVGISHQTENEKESFVYAPDTYISPFVVALAAGVNSNPFSKERFFLRTANPRLDPNSCILYDVI